MYIYLLLPSTVTVDRKVLFDFNQTPAIGKKNWSNVSRLKMHLVKGLLLHDR